MDIEALLRRLPWLQESLHENWYPLTHYGFPGYHQFWSQTILLPPDADHVQYLFQTIKSSQCPHSFFTTSKYVLVAVFVTRKFYYNMNSHYKRFLTVFNIIPVLCTNMRHFLACTHLLRTLLHNPVVSYFPSLSFLSNSPVPSKHWSYSGTPILISNNLIVTLSSNFTLQKHDMRILSLQIQQSLVSRAPQNFAFLFLCQNSKPH